MGKVNRCSVEQESESQQSVLDSACACRRIQVAVPPPPVRLSLCCGSTPGSSRELGWMAVQVGAELFGGRWAKLSVRWRDNKVGGLDRELRWGSGCTKAETDQGRGICAASKSRSKSRSRSRSGSRQAEAQQRFAGDYVRGLWRAWARNQRWTARSSVLRFVKRCTGGKMAGPLGCALWFFFLTRLGVALAGCLVEEVEAK